mmetsp:Transcript_29350/g.61198  ORF Transcript_29350/g.61198 Transcript_29350/m.61198 type:complete len:94 (+) Transcript_29350:1023-1304(+)
MVLESDSDSSSDSSSAIPGGATTAQLWWCALSNRFAVEKEGNTSPKRRKGNGYKRSLDRQARPPAKRQSQNHPPKVRDWNPSPNEPPSLDFDS